MRLTPPPPSSTPGTSRLRFSSYRNSKHGALRGRLSSLRIPTPGLPVGASPSWKPVRCWGPGPGPEVSLPTSGGPSGFLRAEAL